MEWATVAAAGFAGFGLGIGLVLGAYTVRRLRRIVRDDRPPES